MRVRTFNADDMHQAMQMIRESMGDDAVILNSKQSANGVSITVATDAMMAVVKPIQIAAPSLTPTKAALPYPIAALQPQIIKRSDISYPQIKEVLSFHDVNPTVIESLLATAMRLGVKDENNFASTQRILSSMLEAQFSFLPIRLMSEGYRYILIGEAGVGKTLSIAKMAAQIVMDRQPVTVISTDIKRAGGVEQLAAFTTILGIDLKIAGNASELAAELRAAPADARVLIDSGGVNPYDNSELDSLADLLDIDNVEPVLVLAANTGSKDANDIARAFSRFAPRRLLVTKIDATRRFGGILNVANAANLAFCNVSSTPKAVGEFRELNAGGLSKLLMQYKLET